MGKMVIFTLENGDLTIQKDSKWVFNMIYPLVNVYITNWKEPPFFMGRLTISTGPWLQ